MKPNIAKVLKTLRSTHNKTQQNLADILDISRQAYSRYESSMREPNLETLSKIAEYYQVSPEVFFIDDIEKLLSEDMDLVELITRYQLKQKINKPQKENEAEGLQKFTENQDIEQIQQALRSQFGLEAIAKETTKKKRRIPLYILYGLIVLFLINIGFMSLHRFDTNFQYELLNHTYVNAITPDQNVNQTMYSDIIKISPFDPDTIQTGDLIVIYSDFGLNEYFVEEVISVNTSEQSITASYDGITTAKFSYNNIPGKYENEANLLGTIYYASKFNLGYLYIVLGHILVLAIYYISFIDTNKK